MLGTTLRALFSSTAKLVAPGSASSSRAISSVNLGNLAPAPGSTTNDTRYGRGPGSQKGGTSGRGHKGQKARNGKGVRLGFEGGQTPLFKKVPKRGFNNFTAKKYAPLSIATLQKWIALSRISPSEPITIATVVRSNAVHGLSHWSGVKLLSDVNPELPLPALNLELSRYSKAAAKIIMEAGGTLKAVYHNNLSLRKEIFPHKFEGRDIKSALPTRKTDILYYTNPDNFGYLAEEMKVSPVKLTPEDWVKMKKAVSAASASEASA